MFIRQCYTVRFKFCGAVAKITGQNNNLEIWLGCGTVILFFKVRNASVDKAFPGIKFFSKADVIERHMISNLFIPSTLGEIFPLQY